MPLQSAIERVWLLLNKRAIGHCLLLLAAATLGQPGWVDWLGAALELVQLYKDGHVGARVANSACESLSAASQFP